MNWEFQEIKGRQDFKSISSFSVVFPAPPHKFLCKIGVMTSYLMGFLWLESANMWESNDG